MKPTKRVGDWDNAPRKITVRYEYTEEEVEEMRACQRRVKDAWRKLFTDDLYPVEGEDE